jgi:hypothetical protein
VQLMEFKTCPGMISDDDTIVKDGHQQYYQKQMDKAQLDAGLVDIAPLLESYLKDAGFEDIKVVIKKLPLGPWAKDRKKKVRLVYKNILRASADVNVFFRSLVDGVWPSWNRVSVATVPLFSHVNWGCRLKIFRFSVTKPSKKCAAAMSIHTLRSKYIAASDTTPFLSRNLANTNF